MVDHVHATMDCKRYQAPYVMPTCACMHMHNLHAGLAQDVALACGLPHIAAWAEGQSSSMASISSGGSAAGGAATATGSTREASGGGGGGSAVAGEAAWEASGSASLAPATPLLGGSSLPRRKRTNLSGDSSRDGVASITSSLPASDPGTPAVEPTSQQYHEYLHWLQQEVLHVLDEVQHEAVISSKLIAGKTGRFRKRL
jgi:hypothetical protein